MNEFKVTFTQKKKYLPQTRTISVQTSGNFIDAFSLVSQQFGKKGILITSIIDKDGVNYMSPDKVKTPTEGVVNSGEITLSPAQGGSVELDSNVVE